MAFQYTNRRGDVYFIRAVTRGKKTAYSASRKPDGNLVEELPEGYEIYERPESAQVFARKPKLTQILSAEQQLLENSIRDLADVDHFIVEAETRSLVVYLSDSESDVRLTMMRHLAPMTSSKAEAMKAIMIRRAKYSKVMQFTLEDPDARSFSAERWCFSGSIDDWIPLACDAPLPELIQKYVPHLGRESFFDLHRRSFMEFTDPE